MNDSSSSASAVAARLADEVQALSPGARLPSQRELVRRFGASASTITQALAQLSLRGLVETRPGAGTFRAAERQKQEGDTSWQDAAIELTEGLEERPGIRRRFSGSALSQVLAANSPDVIDLNGGYLHPVLQPSGILAAALTRVSRRPEAWDRPPAAGILGLRDWFARDIGAGLSRHDIIVAPGGQSALATALRALTGPGDAAVIESPTYPGTIAAAQTASLRLVPVPLDGNGIIPAHLDEALERSRARVVIVQPLHQNPTGVTMTPERQREVLAVVRRHNAFLIEDDFARHLTHDGTWTAPAPLVADDPDGNVIHIRSLTKTTSPNLRIAAVAARGPILGRLQGALTIDNLLVPAVLQHTALEVVTAPGWGRFQAGLRAELGRRREHAAAQIINVLGEGALPRQPRGGYHLWVHLPSYHSGSELARAALASGVALTSGDNYFTHGNERRPNLRVSYVAVSSIEEIQTGINRLGALIG